MQIVSNSEGRGLAFLLGATLVSNEAALDGIVKKSGVIDPDEAVLFAGDGFGAVASSVAAKRPVFGASAWTDRINEYPDRMFELAANAGMVLPRFRITDGEEALSGEYEKISHRVYIQKKGGIRLSVEAFYADGQFRHYFAKYHGDRIMYDNTGPVVGRSTCLIFSQPNTALKKYFERIAPILALEAPEYRGPVTIEARISDEVSVRSIRFGYDFDFEYAKIALCGKEVLTGKVKPPLGFGSTIRLCDIRNDGIPADNVVTDKYCIPVMVMEDGGSIRSCGETVAVCIGIGETIKTSFENCIEVVKKVKSIEMCYRPDGGTAALKWWKEAQKTGILK